MKKKCSYAVFLLFFVLFSVGIIFINPLASQIISDTNSFSINNLMSLFKFNTKFFVQIASDLSRTEGIQFYKFIYDEALSVTSPTIIYIVIDSRKGTGAAIANMKSAAYNWNKVDQGYLVNTYTLSKEQCESLSNLISATDFFNINAHDSQGHGILDGSTWTIEVVSKNQYHVVTRRSPDLMNGRIGCKEIYMIGMLMFEIVDYWTLLDNELKSTFWIN